MEKNKVNQDNVILKLKKELAKRDETINTTNEKCKLLEIEVNENKMEVEKT